jgi:RimJ/RimL family protein N-acetyltransferase
MTHYIYEENLESERLRTRKLTENDISVLVTFFEDKEATQFLFLESLGLNSNLEIAAHMIKKQMERYSENRFGLQALIDKKTNNFIGICGLLTQNVDGVKEIEVGYHVIKKYWGQGYAPEAAKLFIDYAFKNNLTESIISVIDLENTKSQRVAEKNGLTIEKQTKWLDNEDVYIYRINKTTP